MVNMDSNFSAHPFVKEIIYEPLLKENLKTWFEEKNNAARVKLTKTPDLVVYSKKCPTCGQVIESDAIKIEIERSPKTYNHGSDYCDVIYAVDTEGVSNLNGIPVTKIPKEVIRKSTITVLYFSEHCDANEAKEIVSKFDKLILRISMKIGGPRSRSFSFNVIPGVMTRNQALEYFDKQSWGHNTFSSDEPITAEKLDRKLKRLGVK